MKNNYATKILTLTMKQLKKAEQELKMRKEMTYDGASYDVICCKGRVVKLSGIDVRVTDESGVIDFPLYAGPMKDATYLQVGKYVQFHLSPKRNILKGMNVESFGFDVVGIKSTDINSFLAHLSNCLFHKIGRQIYKSKIGQDQQNQVKEQDLPNSSKNSSKQANFNNKNSDRLCSMESEIRTYCKNLQDSFDKQKIAEHFAGQYELTEIQNILELLSEKGLIMDLGLVYEWVGQQQDEPREQ